MKQPNLADKLRILSNRWQHTITQTIYQIRQVISEESRKSKSPKFDGGRCELVADMSELEFAACGRTSNISQTNYTQVWHLVEFGLLKQL